jgi:hypothetical protein
VLTLIVNGVARYFVTRAARGTRVSTTKPPPGDAAAMSVAGSGAGI